MDPSRSQTINVAAIESGLGINVYLVLFSCPWAPICVKSSPESQT